MAKIEGIQIRNYRVLKNVTLGKLWNTQQEKPLTPMTAVIGKNGVGKSSLFSDGFAKVRRASDDQTVKAMVEEGLPLGGLWYSDYLDER